MSTTPEAATIATSSTERSLTTHVEPDAEVALSVVASRCSSNAQLPLFGRIRWMRGGTTFMLARLQAEPGKNETA
jgi:hypothetical protein